MNFRKLAKLAVVVEALPLILFYAIITGAANEIANGLHRGVGMLTRRPTRSRRA